MLLVGGLLLDNVLIFPDLAYEKWAVEGGNVKKPPWTLACHSQRCGCVMNSHAWWHVLSLASVVIQTVGREYALHVTDLQR
jgi:hypothetical protein